MNVVDALVAVSADVGVVGKDREMSQGQKYAYRSIEQITPRVHAAFIAHGVVCSPRVVTAEYRDVATKSGGTMREATLTVEYTFSTADSSLVACVMGEATDSSDKASNKALTAAWKNALVQVLCIPVESADDPDHQSVERGNGKKPRTNHKAVKEELVTAAALHPDPKEAAAQVWRDQWGDHDPPANVPAVVVADMVQRLVDASPAVTEWGPGEEPFDG